MTQASVGFHCPECLNRGGQRVYQGPVGFDPLVTKVLIGLNMVLSAAALIGGGSLGRLTGSVLRDWSLFGPLVDDGETYRIVTSAFLHDGLVHLGFNMMALWILGSSIEQLFGRPRFVALYAVSMLGGAFGMLLLDPVTPAVGASGAVFGLFGAVAVTQRAQGINVWQSGLGVVLGLNLLITFAVPQISIGGHLGGLAAGTALTVGLVPLARARSAEWVPIVAAVVMSAMLYAGCVWAASQWLDPVF